MCHAACHVMKLLVQLINLSIVLLKVICYNKGSDNITGCQDGQAVDMLRACGGGGGLGDWIMQLAYACRYVSPGMAAMYLCRAVLK